MITQKASITVASLINAPVETVWNFWTEPQYIIRWNQASEDWCSPRAENDLRVGGTFLTRMEAKDGSMGFDFTGVYTRVDQHHQIEYRMDDGRQVQITFEPQGSETRVTETFDAEGLHSEEMQRAGWQAILDNFKAYTEAAAKHPVLNFEVSINAPAEKVYQTMLDQEQYREWTALFNPSSRYSGSWDKGAKIIFVGTDQDGTQGGMVSRIRENIPNRYVSVEHRGILKGEEEITSGPEVDGWAGALENYTFEETGGTTRLLVDMDANPEFQSYFEETWPKALNRLKELCEKE